MLPSWAPNAHPLVIHFPIVLVIAALTADVIDQVLDRPAWLRTAATIAYVAGALSAAVAYWTGVRAAATVLVPGMAPPLIEDHRVWALSTLAFLLVLAVGRVGAALSGATWGRGLRMGLAAAGLVAALLVQQTAERGARLVYEQGVGVIPGSR